MADSSFFLHRIIKIVRVWINMFYSDFLDNTPLLEQLDAFENQVLAVAGKSPSWRMLCIERVRTPLRTPLAGLSSLS